MKSLLSRLRAGEPPPFPVTDLHGHVGRYAFAIPDLSAEGLLRVMDRTGVGRMVCSHMQCMGPDTAQGNAMVADFMRRAPGRILGYVSVFPSSADRVRSEVRRWLDAGFVGIKLHNANGIGYDDPAYVPAFELADRRCLPVLLHTWGTPAEFDVAVAVARAFPRLTVILAHGGCADPEGYARTVQKAPNLVMDTCFSRSPLGLVERLAASAGADRIVFGSDCCFYSLTQQLGKIMAAGLDDRAKRLILAENGDRILARARVRGHRS